MDRPAGTRTYAVVGIGACLFTVAAEQAFSGADDASGIWAVAAVGMSFGFGLYVLAIGTTAILLVTIAVIGRLLPTELGGTPPD